MRAVGAHGLERPLRLLLSYHYYKDENLDELLDSCFPEGVQLDIFSDSGAFSAMTLGQPIPEDDYIAWVERWQHRLTVACGPDVIGDPAATYAATVRMKQRITSIPVLPTFHVGEDWSWLTKCCELSDYIALGGMVPYSRDKRILGAWLRKAFSIIPDHVRVHGFGMTTWQFLKEFPWYSVDSSSWTAGFRYAQLALFDDARGRFVDIKMGDPKSALQHSKLLETYGLRPSQVQASSYDRDLICGVSVVAWQRAEAWLEKQKIYMARGSLPIAGAPNRPEGVAEGLRTYLSCGSLPAGEHGNGHVRSLKHAVASVRSTK